MSALTLYRDENSAKVTSFGESVALSSVKSELACENLSIGGGYCIEQPDYEIGHKVTEMGRKALHSPNGLIVWNHVGKQIRGTCGSIQGV